MFTVTVVDPAQLHVNAVAKTPSTPVELRQARVDLQEPLTSAFKDSTFTVDQQNSIRDLCAEFRPVVSLSMQELGTCTVAEATFPVPENTVPVD